MLSGMPRALSEAISRAAPSDAGFEVQQQTAPASLKGCPDINPTLLEHLRIGDAQIVL
jgi:hypothetical protein